jgi:hypothetical protein
VRVRSDADPSTDGDTSAACGYANSTPSGRYTSGADRDAAPDRDATTRTDGNAGAS